MFTPTPVHKAIVSLGDFLGAFRLSFGFSQRTLSFGFSRTHCVYARMYPYTTDVFVCVYTHTRTPFRTKLEYTFNTYDEYRKHNRMPYTEKPWSFGPPNAPKV